MKQNIFKLFTLLLTVLLLTQTSFAQKEKKRKKTIKEENQLIIQDFNPTDTTSVLQQPGIDFPNINIIPSYYNPAKLAQIKRYQMNKQWPQMFNTLYQYVSNFGIENFKDMELVWQLAKLAEYLEEKDLAKDLYRLIIKHQRGNFKDVMLYYDSLTEFERPKYADLEYYFRLVERRKEIDTLAPPQGVLLNMGETVNSQFDDYAVTVVGEFDEFIYFSSRRGQAPATSANFLKSFGSISNEDIYVAQRDEDGFWGQAQEISDISTAFNEGSPCVSRDGQTLIFVRCFSPDGLGDCDLYEAKKLENGQWSNAFNLGKNVNSNAWDSHPAFSVTGDTLFFSSSRAGGFGGTDIYYTIKDDKGSWRKPLNLGPIINTKGRELSPYPHPRFNVLYFSSDSSQLLNFGGFDIYKSFNVNNEWSEPKNVGPLVNGEGDEIYFSIDSESQFLFYAKSMEENGKNLDLHSFPLPMEAKPNNTVRFSGKIVEPVTGEVFKGVVTVLDLTEATEVAPKQIREDGTFEFELINYRKYLLLIEGDNFFNIEEVFYIEEDMSKEYDAIPIKNIVFKSIDFKSGSSELLPEMENNLHLVIDFLLDHPNYDVSVMGHTDSDGDRQQNLKLSQSRADAIKKFIISYGGLEESRVTAIGKGSEEPIIPNAKAESDKKINRRVEFKITPSDAKTTNDF